MEPYYFTFGYGHHDENHTSLGGHYTKITAETENAAREIMYQRRGNKFCSTYSESFRYQNITRYRQIFVPFDEITAQNGPTK